MNYGIRFPSDDDATRVRSCITSHRITSYCVYLPHAPLQFENVMAKAVQSALDCLNASAGAGELETSQRLTQLNKVRSCNQS